jgi:hypothetical protein
LDGDDSETEIPPEVLMISSIAARPMGIRTSRSGPVTSPANVAELLDRALSVDIPACVSLDIDRGYELADRILALGEPWRVRFVDYIATRAGNDIAGDRPPTRSELAAWLTNQRLHHFVCALLRAWEHDA